MERLLTTVLLFLLCMLYCQAQVDSSYIRPFSQEFAIKPLLYYNYTSIIHEIDEKNEETYRPNSPVSVGFNLAYKNFSFTIGYGFNFMRDSKKGDTKSLDLQYHYFGRKIVTDVFFQRYKGYYMQEDEKQYTLFPDIRISQYGVHSLYVFNHHKFSYKAAFDQSEKQLRSAGSWQAGGGIYYNEIASDSTLSLTRGRIQNYQISISGGYVHTWVINRRLFISGGLSIGANFGMQDTHWLKKVELSPSMFPRLSVGYVATKWSLGVSAMVNRMYVTHNDPIKMLFDTGYFQIGYTKRFDSGPAFMKKIKWLN